MIDPPHTSALTRRWQSSPPADQPERGITRRTSPEQPAPLSYSQERMWFLEQYVPGTAAYHIWLPLRARGPLDLSALDTALTEVVARHASLRTRFPTTADGDPLVAVDPPEPVRWTRLDVAGAADPDQAARGVLEPELLRPFDLAAGPLLRPLVVRLGRDDHVLCLVMHHLVTDGWSVERISDELGVCYDAARAGRPAGLAPLPIEYGDFARWQRAQLDTGGTSRDLAFWQERLTGMPALQLPTDRPYPPTQTAHGAFHSFPLDAQLCAAVERLGRASRATPFMTLLAGYQALLGWWCGQDTFAVGAPVSGRYQPEIEPLVGPFVNTLVFRAELAGDPTFRTLLTQVRNEAITAFAHQRVPFEAVVAQLPLDRDVRRPPVFQVSFAMQNYTRGYAAARGSLPLEPFEIEVPATRHELALYLYPDGAELRGVVNYNADLFDAATITTLFERYVALLRQITTDPDVPLSALDLLTEQEHATLQRFSGADQAPPPAPPGWQLLTDPFDAWVARTPDAPAVACGDQRLSYRELAGRANRLAHRLRGLGVGPDQPVGICLEQSTDLAVAMLAVLKAGGAYLPLDPEQPPARLAFLLADAQAGVVVTDPELAGRLPDFPGQLVTEIPAGDTAAAPPVPTGPDHLAYVIYTSGSTGTPKGVAVQHRQVLNYLAGIRTRLDIMDGASYGLLQSLAFDFAVTMFYLALATGGCLHLIPRRCGGRELADYLASASIDYLKMTPSHLAALAADVPEQELLPRRALILGGEASRSDWTRRLASLTGAAVVNHYGPTEATVGVTTYQVDPDRDPGTVTTPIGRPLPYAQVRVLDRIGRPVPVGAVGEVHLGGDRLAREYLGRPELTAQQFVPDSAGPPGARLYRTGDLARWLATGDLEFLGRRDNQVKLRGYRVELGEVEAALAGLPEVGAAVVTVHHQNLCAYLEPVDPAVRPGITQVRELLAQTLPEYLLPARAIWLDRLPLMAHGKVDRAALPAPTDERPDQAVAYAPPAGPVQEAIAAVWRTVLKVDRVGADDSFFDLGGHSLLATQVVSRLRRSLPAGARPVTLLDLFKHPTVRELAAVASTQETAETRLLHELTRPIEQGKRQLSLVCVPYGGASAVVYQPLADALPEGVSLYSVAMPGHDVGDLTQTEPSRPLAEVAAELAAEVRERVSGPLVLYGHCGPGGALAVAVARQLEAAGRELAAVYLGGIFPFARPTGLLGRLRKRFRLDRFRSDTVYANWLQSMGADTGALDPAERRHLIRLMRQDAENAEDYFTELFAEQGAPLRAPIISVVGERDPGTEYYAERYREWDFLSPRTSLVVIDEAGHYFLKYRADELASIVTRVHPAVAAGDGQDLRRAGRPDATWWLHDPGARTAAGPTGPRPSMGRFLTVAIGQLVSMTGTALTEFAVPIWAYVNTGSLLQFALFAVVALLPGILVAPVAGALVDRADRRKALIAANLAAGGLLGILALLLATGDHSRPVVYVTLAVLSAVLSVQRLAYMSAVPQLVPKRYLGNANGVVQFGTGTAQFLVPLLAVALLNAVGMQGVLAFAMGSYLVSLVILLVVRFPQTMAWHRRETVLAEIRNGYRYFFARPGLRAMLMFFVTLNAPLAAATVLLSPLVLSVGTLTNAGQVAMVSAGGAIAGGLLMAVWGGPKQRRMRGMLWTAVGLAVSAAVIGLRPSLLLIAVGAFCLSFSLAIVNGIWLTIIHTKVPQRFHARVIALNQMVALSVVSLGFLLAPLASAALAPLMQRDGLLAGSVGAAIGVGDGRGIALLYLLCGLALAGAVVVSLSRPVLAHFDRDVPDAEPDDLVGLATLRARHTGEPPALAAAGSRQSGTGATG